MKMRIVNQLCLSLILIVAICRDGRCDEWPVPQPQEYVSDNGRYILRIVPSSPTDRTLGKCSAELLEVSPTDRSTKSLWARMLINDRAPVSVYIADSGNYVVTMDEWHSVGRLPVVIYGENGHLINVLSLRDLGVEADAHVRQSASSYWWDENSVTCFGITYHDYQIDPFFIRLHWGKIIAINLRRGEVVDETWMRRRTYWPELGTKLKVDAGRSLGERILLLLKHPQEKGYEYKLLAPILAAGQMKLKDAIPLLREKLKSKPEEIHYSGSQPAGVKVYYIRKAAKEALEAMGEEVKGVIIEEKLDHR